MYNISLSFCKCRSGLRRLNDNLSVLYLFISPVPVGQSYATVRLARKDIQFLIRNTHK
jgi:hypothetical protein